MTLFRGVFLLLCLCAWSCAEAQVLDGIEINRVGKEAEIRIRFTTEIQYLRHTPLDQGKLLRVSLRLANPQIVERDLPQETLNSPDTDLVPKFSVTFPELVNGMLISFAQSTQFKVKPGSDTRSIVVTVPILPGAKDLSVEERAPHTAAEVAQSATPSVVTSAIATTVAPAVAIAAPKAAPIVSSSSVPAAKAAATVAKQPPPAEIKEPAQPSVPLASPQTAPPAVPALAADAGAAVPPPPVLTQDEIEKLAKTFFTDAKKALDDKDLAKAINRLNRVLGLPSSTQTEAAQALMGQVREMNGEIAKARAEYELFLKAFPNSPEVPNIKARLAALPKDAPRQGGQLAGRVAALPKDAPPAEWVVFGSVAQYWYSGKSHIETTTPPPPGQLTFNTDTLSLTDQDSLISSVDINARRRDAVTDSRAVFRYIDNHNYLQNGKGYSRVNSAYFEQTDRHLGYFFRVGRQNPNGGGVLERFDGATGGYNVSSDWRVNAVAGVPVEFGQTSYKRQFYGTSLERMAQLEQVGYSLYFLNQTLEGAVNRRAVGTDVRYFDSQFTAYGMFDYDIDFKAINIALAQANFRSLGGTNYFAVLDHRKTPNLSLLSAIPAFAGQDIKTILSTNTIDEVRDAGKALTAESNLFSVGFTRPYSERWQYGADYRLAAISGIDGNGLIPAQPGSGNNHVVSGQLIGNSVLRSNDVSVANVSLIHSPTYDGQAYGFNYVIQLLDSLRLDGSLRFYTQKDDTGEKQTRTSPSARLTYRVKETLSLEGEAGNEVAKTDGPTRKDRSDRRYLYFGYRWDLR